MKKTTLKIFTFLLIALAFQAQGQIVDGGIYTMQNKGTSKYLSAWENAGVIQTTYIPVDMANSGYQAFTLLSTSHNSITDLWMINNDLRGLMRAAGSGASINPNGIVHTSTQPAVVTVSNNGDRKFSITSLGNNEYQFVNEGRFLRDQGDGTYFASTTDDNNSIWILQTTTLNTETFDARSVFVSNPVKNELTVQGLTSNIENITVYSIIGKEVMFKSINGASSFNLDVSALARGMYILEFKGENVRFSKKIVKQ